MSHRVISSGLVDLRPFGSRDSPEANLSAEAFEAPPAPALPTFGQEAQFIRHYVELHADLRLHERVEGVREVHRTLRLNLAAGRQDNDLQMVSRIASDAIQCVLEFLYLRRRHIRVAG